MWREADCKLPCTAGELGPVEWGYGTGELGSGDVNCDRHADSVDAALILQYGAALFSDPACDLAADVNGDLAIGPLDAELVLQYEAGLLLRLPT